MWAQAMASRATPMPAAIRAPMPSCIVDPVRCPARSGAASARRAATANQAPAAKNTTHRARDTVLTGLPERATVKADRVAEVPPVPEAPAVLAVLAPMPMPLIPDMPPEVTWPAAPAASSPAGAVTADMATAIQTMAPIIPAWYQPANRPAAWPRSWPAARTRNRASPANQAAPAVNTVTRAMTGTRDPQGHTMLIMARHISTCRPMLITASLRDSRVTTRHKMARYQTHTVANTTVSATRTASLVTT